MHTAHSESVRVGLQNEMIVTKRFLVGRCAGSIYLSTVQDSSDSRREYYVSVAGATVEQGCSAGGGTKCRATRHWCSSVVSATIFALNKISETEGFVR